MIRLSHEPMSDAFDKWHVGGLPVPAVFHRFTAPDLGDPHDHPWSFRSIILFGGYIEQCFAPDGSSVDIERRVGDSFHIDANHVHRITNLPYGQCWTLILPEPSPSKISGFYRWENGQRFHRFWNERNWRVIE